MVFRIWLSLPPEMVLRNHQLPTVRTQWGDNPIFLLGWGQLLLVMKLWDVIKGSLKFWYWLNSHSSFNRLVSATFSLTSLCMHNTFSTAHSVATTPCPSDPSTPSLKDDAHDPNDDLLCGEALLDLYWTRMKMRTLIYGINTFSQELMPLEGWCLASPCL